MGDRRVQRGRCDERDVRSGLEEEEETARGDYATADEEDGPVFELVGDEERSALDDGRVLGLPVSIDKGNM